jgi:hypothetical protein
MPTSMPMGNLFNGLYSFTPEQSQNEFHLNKLHIRVVKSSRKIWVRHVACMREMINACRILVRKSEGKTSLEKPRHNRRILKCRLY